MLGIETVHQNRIDNQQDDEAYNRPLLRHPEAEGRITHLWRMRIQPFAKKDAAAVAHNKPDSQKTKNNFKTCSTMGTRMVNFHSKQGNK